VSDGVVVGLVEGQSGAVGVLVGSVGELEPVGEVDEAGEVDGQSGVVGVLVGDVEPVGELEPVVDPEPVGEVDPVGELDPVAGIEPVAEGEALGDELAGADEGCVAGFPFLPSAVGGPGLTGGSRWRRCTGGTVPVAGTPGMPTTEMPLA
jgi:hypothetical protein